MDLPDESSELLSSVSGSLTDVQVGEFETFYQQQVDDVFRYAHSCVGRREIAEEITADAFLALYRNFIGLDAEAWRPWIFRVVKNMATNHWRRRQVEQKFAAEAPPAVVTESPVEQSILSSSELKPSHRACLLMRYVHGMNRDEIAAATGLTQNQVKSCLQYGLTILRAKLQGKPSPGGAP